MNFIKEKYPNTITQTQKIREEVILDKIERKPATITNIEIWEGDHLFIDFKGWIFTDKVLNCQLIINHPNYITKITPRYVIALIISKKYNK